jgi:hypothetical protein
VQAKVGGTVGEDLPGALEHPIAPLASSNDLLASRHPCRTQRSAPRVSGAITALSQQFPETFSYLVRLAFQVPASGARAGRGPDSFTAALCPYRCPSSIALRRPAVAWGRADAPVGSPGRASIPPRDSTRLSPTM